MTQRSSRTFREPSRAHSAPDEPKLFFITPAYARWQPAMLRLAQIDVQRLAELVTGARRMRAQAALARELGESSGRPGRSEAEHLTGPAYHRYRRQMRIVVAGN